MSGLLCTEGDIAYGVYRQSVSDLRDEPGPCGHHGVGDWDRVGCAGESDGGQPEAGKMLSYTRMRTTISTKGQIVLPAELRAADGIKAGEEFEVDRVGPDEYRLTRLTPTPNRGLVEWLRSCPDDGWFVEIESESTDSL